MQLSHDLILKTRQLALLASTLPPLPDATRGAQQARVAALDGELQALAREADEMARRRARALGMLEARIARVGLGEGGMRV